MEILNKTVLCRACLCTIQDYTPSPSPLTLCNTGIPILDAFTAVTNIEINDCITLCNPCTETLRKCHAFIEQCRASADFFDSKPNVEPEAVVITHKTNKRLRKVTVPTENILEALRKCDESFVLNVRCIKCRFEAKNSRSLGLHINHVHPELKQSWCVHCNKTYEKLTEHLKIHAEIKCGFCSKVFRSKGHFKEHLMSHAGSRPYQCECGGSFLTVRHLKSHVLKHHKQSVESPKPVETGFLCTECGRMFKNPAKLRLHIRSHGDTAPYECEQCSRRFKRRSHFKIHLKTHTGEKTHICDVCGKMFLQSSVLKTHQKLHTGRTETCMICGKRFCRPSELRLHMRGHTGEKPYVCKDCGKRFVQSSHLSEHEKTHSGIRPYSCDHCEKSFKQVSTLKSHVNIHFGYKPYKCNVCDYASRQSYGLRLHMKRRHAQVLENC